MKKRLNRSPGKHHVVLRDGKQLQIRKHTKQFTVHSPIAAVRALIRGSKARTVSLGENVTLVTCVNSASRDEWMDRLRQEFVVHHVYTDVDSRGAVILGDHVYIRFRGDRKALCSRVCGTYALNHVDTLGGTDVLQLTRETGCNPLKIAMQLRELDYVESCLPEFLSRARGAASALLNSQWHLSDAFTGDWSSSLIKQNASVKAELAWQKTRGSSDVVVAVMDDGFDLRHEVFSGPDKVHPRRRDFADSANGAEPKENDFHGTPVAAISIANGNEISGIAPDCTLLPLRVNTNLVSARDVIGPFRHASEHADVLNISLEMVPQSFVHDILAPQTGFLEELRTITSQGGRRRKGLVIVVAAGNSDLPTRMTESENKARRKYRTVNGIKTFSSGSEIYTGYPNLPGVIVVSAVTSKLQKSGYSNWGNEISVCACSDNADPQGDASPDFPGASIVTAQNRHRGGVVESNPAKPGFTRKFGGTSAAAPIVAGIAALVISANPDLEAWEVRRIIESTAFKGLDTTIDVSKSPNLLWTTTPSVAVDGRFVDGKSMLFGYGRANAHRAIERAFAYRELVDGSVVNAAEFATPFVVSANDRRGVSKYVRLSPDQVTDLRLKVAGSHGDSSKLTFTLVTPDGYLAAFSPPASASSSFSSDFSPANTETLRALVKLPIDGNGRWIVNVQNADTAHDARISQLRIEVT